MTSITKMLILITTITAIDGKAFDFSIDADRPSAKVSHRDELLDTLSRLKLITPEYDELDFILPLWTELDVLPPSLKADTTNIKSIVSQHGNRRERRQALFKTIGPDDGADSVMSLANSRYPLNVARFPNDEVVNYTNINREVMKWIRLQMIVEMMNRIHKSTLPTDIVDPPQSKCII